MIEKIRRTIEDKAKGQLKQAREKGMQLACYLLVNITADILFEWENEYTNVKETLKEEYCKQGLEILIEDAGYL